MPNITIKQIVVGPMMNFAYLIADGKAGLCAAVDPGWEAEKIADEAKNLGCKIDKIILTHGHFDHAQDIEKLAQLTSAPVFVHKLELDELSSSLKKIPTEEGSLIEVGGVKIKCLHTPGHTPGSQCLLVDGSIITGDTLFVDACGRVDLPGSNPREMLKSLSRLSKLAPETVVYPGHDYGHAPTDTIGNQLKTNPYLSTSDEGML